MHIGPAPHYRKSYNVEAAQLSAGFGEDLGALSTGNDALTSPTMSTNSSLGVAASELLNMTILTLWNNF